MSVVIVTDSSYTRIAIGNGCLSSYKVVGKESTKMPAKKMSSKIRVLNNFRPYLRLLNAFKFDNFHQSDWYSIRQSIYYAIYAALLLILIPVAIVLGAWYLIENLGDLRKIIVVFPLLISMVQVVLSFVALIRRNILINETIYRIQHMTNRRKYLILVVLVAFRLKQPARAGILTNLVSSEHIEG